MVFSSFCPVFLYYFLYFYFFTRSAVIILIFCVVLQSQESRFYFCLLNCLQFRSCSFSSRVFQYNHPLLLVSIFSWVFDKSTAPNPDCVHKKFNFPSLNYIFYCFISIVHLLIASQSPFTFLLCFYYYYYFFV